MMIAPPIMKTAWHNGSMKENAYFDNAATTWPKPEAVYLFIDQFQRSHGVNPSRGGYAMAVEAEAMVIQTRQMLATFLGYSGPANRVVFTANVTDSLNMALTGLLKSGDHVVTTRLEHNAVLRTTRYLQRDKGIEVTQAPVNEHGIVSVETLRSSVQKNTAAIVLNHASNVTGRVQPLADIGQLAQELSIPLIVDTAQTAGVLPISMESTGVSVLTFTGHKGLFGPMGVGGMIVDESVDLDVTKFGGNGILSESEFQPEVWPHRHEAGTLAMPAIAGLHGAQRWFNAVGESLASAYGITQAKEAQKLSVSLSEESISKPLNSEQHRVRTQDTVQHIHRTEMKHLEKITDALLGFDHVRILGGEPVNQEHAQVATLSFVSNKVPTQRIAEALDTDFHVCLRAGLHCAPLVHADAGTIEQDGAVRLAPGYFTDEQDMIQLLDGLNDVLS